MPRKEYPAPLEIPTAGEIHTHTIIALHGRGSNAEKFGHELMASANLQSRLPTVKFVFPTASKRRSTVLKKIPINQWFDNYSLDDPGQRTDLQISGLCETAQFLLGIISKEANILGEGGDRKVVLWCLSQGCAAGIFAVLGGWPDDANSRSIGAFVGMSGWLPFEKHLRDILQCDDRHSPSHESHETEYEEDEEEDESSSDEEPETGHISDDDFQSDPFHQFSQPHDDFDVFAREVESETPLSVQAQAVDYIRDILDLPALSTHEDPPAESSLSQLGIPVFIGHGAQDPKVSVGLGEKMSKVLSSGLGMNVTWKPYEGLGHWYRGEDEVEDILRFLEARVQIPLAAEERPTNRPSKSEVEGQTKLSPSPLAP